MKKTVKKKTNRKVKEKKAERKTKKKEIKVAETLKENLKEKNSESSAVELQFAKGTRDFPPEEKIIRDEVVNTLVRIFEQFGYSPLETPVLERFDVLAAKYAGGAEILKETFKLKDQGDRELGLRYDLTVPFCRFVGMNPTLKMPFKRYQMGQVFRDGPIKLGRYREFWQCDVDIVGTKNMMADAEMILIAEKFFREINFDVIVEFNSRKILDGIMEYLEIPDKKRIDAILVIDKLRKIGEEEVSRELQQSRIFDSQKTKKLFELIKIQGKNIDRVKFLRQILKNSTAVEGLNEIEEVIGNIGAVSDQSNVVFNVSLARGLAYYTGTIFEVFLKNPQQGDIKSALAGGGRYDRMIGQFLQNNNEYPAIGISFGLEPITEQLKIYRASKKETVKKTVTKVFVLPINTPKESLKIVSELRKEGINADIDLVGRGISRNLDYVNSLGIPYVLIVGQQELQKNKVKLKDMASGKEEFLSLNEACRRLK